MGRKTPGNGPPAAGADAQDRANQQLASERAVGDPAMSAEAGRLLQEVRIRGIELEVQNEELRATEEDLSASRDAYAGLFDGAPVGYLAIDGEGGILRANLTAAHLIGVEREELEGAPITRFVLADDQDAFYFYQRRLRATGERQECELRLRRPGEEIPGEAPFWAHIEGRPEPQGDGSTATWITFADVTQRRLADEALHDSEARYRGYFDQSFVGVAVTSPDKGWIDVNEATCALLGYGRDELSRLTWAELTHPDDLAADVVQFERLLAGEIDAYRLEKRFVRKDGGVVFTDMSIQCERDAAGGVTYVLAFLSDVTQRKVAEAAREAAEFRRLAILDSMLDPHVLLRAVRDATGAIVDFLYADANRAACEYMSLEREKLLGATVLGLLPGQAGSGMLALYTATVESGKPLVLDDYSYAHEIVGSERRYDIRAVVVDDALSFTWRDVTERHQAARALAESEERFRLLAENAADVVIQGSNEGVIQWASPSVTALTGLSTDELVGRPFAELVHPDDAVDVRAAQAALSRGERARLEVRVETAAGDYHWIAGDVRPTFDRAGKVTGRVAGWRDVQAERETRIALERSEARFRAVTDTAADAIVTADVDGVISGWNAGAERMFGYSAGEAIGGPVTLVMPQRYAADHPELMSRVRETDERRVMGRVVELEGLRRDGSEFPIELSMAEWEVDDERYVTTIIRDIAERRVAAAALADSEARLRAIVEGASEGINVLDLRSGRYTFMSPAQVAMTGFTPEEMNDLPAEDAYERLHPDDRQTSIEQQKQLASGQDEFAAVEYRWRVKSGEYRWFRDARRLLRDAAGEPYALVGVSTDITEQKRLEHNLRASEQMRTISEGVARVGSFSWDITTGHTTWSPEMFRLFDFPPEEFGEDATKVLDSRMHPEDRVKVTEATETAAATGRPVPIEFRVVWRDGSVHTLASSATTSYDGAGRPVALVGYYQDVTEARRAEDEIRHLNDDLEERVQQRTAQLEASNQELEAFVYSASHDLRAPLRAIDGFSQVVVDDAADRLNEDDVAHLQRVRAAAQRMAVLIDQLMALSRSSRAELFIEDVDVSALAESVMQELRAPSSGREVEAIITPDMHAQADATLLRAILANLIGNAWKFTSRQEAARIEVGVTDAGGKPTFFVRDDGVGFDAKHVEHLFGAFQRYHDPDEFPGDGIGLATVQRLVARHGGRAWAESEVEKGATFYFTLPPEAGDDSARGPATAPEAAGD